MPREPKRSACPGEVPVETQLRDVAILMTIVLLFVLTIQVLWLTAERPRRDRDGK